MRHRTSPLTNTGGAVLLHADNLNNLTAAGDEWPAFAPQALERGFRSVHAVPLRLRSQVIC